MKKICSKCKIEKDITEFNKQKRGKYGVKSICKKCEKTYREANKEKIKAWRDANKEKLKEQRKAYYQANKEKIREKEKTYYQINKDKIMEQKRAYGVSNRDKKKEYNKSYYQTNSGKLREQKKTYYQANSNKLREQKKIYYRINKDKISERQKAYFQTEIGKEAQSRARHKRRALKQKVSHLGNYTKQDLDECRKFFNNCCAYSGEPLKDNEEVEHIIPLSKGGTNNPNNIVLATREVNRSKGANGDWVKWYREQPFYSKERENKIKQWIQQKTQINLLDVI